MTKETQEQFWDLVDKGAVKVECKQACIDALNDTPNIDLDEFLAEAKDHQWIGDYYNPNDGEGYGSFDSYSFDEDEDGTIGITGNWPKFDDDEHDNKINTWFDKWLSKVNKFVKNYKKKAN